MDNQSDYMHTEEEYAAVLEAREQDKATAIAKKLKNMGMTTDVIKQATGLSADEVVKIL